MDDSSNLIRLLQSRRGVSEANEVLYITDWSKTPLGRIESWPQSLKSAIAIMMTTNFPMFIYWGSEYLCLYNDGFVPIIGNSRRMCMGLPGPQVFPEVWPTLEPMLENVWKGEVLSVTDFMLPIAMEGRSLERYFTWSYSPIYEGGVVGGILTTATETTSKIISDRRLRCLHDITSTATKANATDEAFKLLISTVENYQVDLPIVVLYSVGRSENNETVLKNQGTIGITPESPLSPEHIVIESLFTENNNFIKQIRDAAIDGQSRTVDISEYKIISRNSWNEKITECVILPLRVQDSIRGILVAAVNPLSFFDENYKKFFNLLSAQIGSMLSNVYAREEERKRAEMLAEIDRTKTTFFSNISHEFRTPLTLMLGPVEDLLNSNNDPENYEQLRLIHRNALRLLKLVNTLLDFARIESDRIHSTFTPVDLKSVCEDLASVFRSACERVGLQLIIDCEAISEPVYVDIELWEKIVMNLLSNAYKFTLEGYIALKLKQTENDFIELIVEDTGTGIPPEEIGKLFQRFHRVSGANGRSHEGTGIGLAMVSELVKVHGGTVTVTSKMYKGTTFTVKIPMGTSHLPKEQIVNTVSKKRKIDSHIKSAEWWLGSISESISDFTPEKMDEDTKTTKHSNRILVVDDNTDMRKYIVKLLKNSYVVDEAVDGLDALDKISKFPPDLVLTDMMMPRMDGLGLLQALRKDPMTAIIPVVILSARAGDDTRVEGLQYGADDYLVKPFTARELMARIETHLKLNKLRFTAAKQVELANRARDHLAVLSHELRTPLTPALMLAESMAMNESLPLKVREDSFMISRNIKLEVRLIDDLLDITKISKNKLIINEKPVDIHDEITHTLSLVEHDALSKEITLVHNFEAKISTIMGDAARIQQIFWNLIKNSVKFTPNGGAVTITTSNDTSSTIKIEVKDNGIGIEPNSVVKVFEAFEQADSSITRKFGGLGIGLSITKGLVELHNGKIGVSSEGHGRGSLFTVILPVVDKPVEVNSKYVKKTLSFEGVAKNVLLVEDNKSTLLVMSRMLKKLGHNVISAMTVKEALEKSKQHEVDLVVSDIGLPDGSGQDLMRKLHEHKPGLKGIAASGFGTQDDIEESIASGFMIHLTKPIEMSVLKTAMNEAIAK